MDQLQMEGVKVFYFILALVLHRVSKIFGSFNQFCFRKWGKIRSVR